MGDFFSTRDLNREVMMTTMHSERGATMAVTPTPAEVAAHMFANDRASRGLGMRIVDVGDGTATLTMTVRADMLNGLDICHGGFITTLADSAFAFACNSSNRLTVAAGLTMDFVASPREHDVLTARAIRVSSSGRTGVYDIVVDNQRGERIALMRGRSHALHGRFVIEPASADAQAVSKPAAHDGAAR